MTTRVVSADPDQPDAQLICDAADLLRQEGLVAFPTETVYGLAAMAENEAAVRRVFAAKERPVSQPLSLQVAHAGELAKVAAGISDKARTLIRRFMPGPLTIVLEAAAMLPEIVTAGQGKVGVRIPDHPVALALLQAAGQPLVVTSANRHGRPAPLDAQGVLAQLDGKIDLLLDGGPCPLGVESTVIDLTVEPPVILRPGAVSREKIESLIGAVGSRA